MYHGFRFLLEKAFKNKTLYTSIWAHSMSNGPIFRKLPTLTSWIFLKLHIFVNQKVINETVKQKFPALLTFQGMSTFVMLVCHTVGHLE